MSKKIAMLIAFQDFRDEEYFIPKSLFQREGIEVITASAESGDAVGAFGGVVKVVTTFDDLRIEELDGLVFVGGSGATRYLDNKQCYKLAKEALDKGKVLSAICIAPAILAKAGLLKGRKATVWASAMDKSAVRMLKDGGANYVKEKVVVDGNVVTADGPESARKFAETILGLLTKLPE